MYLYHLKELIETKEIQDKKKYSILELSNGIDVPRPTLTKIKESYINADQNIVVTTETLEKILKYFKCNKITELIEYIPDNQD